MHKRFWCQTNNRKNLNTHCSQSIFLLPAVQKVGMIINFNCVQSNRLLLWWYRVYDNQLQLLDPIDFCSNDTAYISTYTHKSRDQTSIQLCFWEDFCSDDTVYMIINFNCLIQSTFALMTLRIYQHIHINPVIKHQSNSASENT